MLQVLRFVKVHPKYRNPNLHRHSICSCGGLRRPLIEFSLYQFFHLNFRTTFLGTFLWAI